MGEDAAAGAVVNIDLSGTEAALSKIADALSGDEKKMLKDIAIRLYANSEFDKSGKSAQQLANDAIERAMILISKLPS